MKNLSIDRRKFLRALGTSTFLFTPMLRTLHADAAGVGRKPSFVFFFSPNGTIARDFYPTGDENDFTFGKILQPLEGLKKDLIVLHGVGLQTKGPGASHAKGPGALLTGMPLLPGSQFSGDGGSPSGWSSGPSLDQTMGNTIGADSPLKTLELAIQLPSGGPKRILSYRASNQPISAEQDPYKAFDRVAGLLVPTDPKQLEEARLRQKSSLDLWTSDLQGMMSRLGGQERAKLEAHLEIYRSIERGLATPAAGAVAVCGPGGKPTKILDVKANDNFPAIGKLQMDVMALAISCGVTRIGTLFWAGENAYTVFSWLGTKKDHHNLSHENNPILTPINRWYAEQFGYFVGKLKEQTTGGGTLLDSSIVIWGNGLDDGKRHNHSPIPFVLAGRCNGAFRPGRFLRYNNIAHNNLLVYVANAMGMNVKTVGKPELCNSPMTNLA